MENTSSPAARMVTRRSLTAKALGTQKSLQNVEVKKLYLFLLLLFLFMQIKISLIISLMLLILFFQPEWPKKSKQA